MDPSSKGVYSCLITVGDLWLSYTVVVLDVMSFMISLVIHLTFVRVYFRSSTIPLLHIVFFLCTPFRFTYNWHILHSTFYKYLYFMYRSCVLSPPRCISISPNSCDVVDFLLYSRLNVLWNFSVPKYNIRGDIIVSLYAEWSFIYDHEPA